MLSKKSSPFWIFFLDISQYYSKKSFSLFHTDTVFKEKVDLFVYVEAKVKPFFLTFGSILIKS